MLTVENIKSGYDRYSVLHGISMVVGQGEIVALIGSNGAGKSTTLKTIIGIVKPQEGRIMLRDKRVDGLSTSSIRKLGISMVPEGRRLFAGMSVLENIQMGAYLRNDHSEVERDKGMVMSLFPILGDRCKQLAGTLSGGEQQMCAVARALMSKPTLLLIDELSLGLAPIVVQELVEKVAQLRDTGTTILLVEQDVTIALQVSDRAYILEQGEIMREGRSSDLIKDKSIIDAYLGI